MTGIPRWLELQEEIDFRVWLLSEVQRENRQLTPLDHLIDEATGRDEQRLARAREIITEIGTLRAALSALEGGNDD